MTKSAPDRAADLLAAQSWATESGMVRRKTADRPLVEKNVPSVAESLRMAAKNAPLVETGLPLAARNARSVEINRLLMAKTAETVETDRL